VTSILITWLTTPPLPRDKTPHICNDFHDLLVGRNPLEIDMQYLLLPRMHLHVAQQHTVLLAVHVHAQNRGVEGLLLELVEQ
jgi:hypothetical protein